MLADRSTPAFPTPDDATLTIDQLLEQFDILVVDIHRTGSMPIDEDRVTFPGSGPHPRPFPGAAAIGHRAGSHEGLWGIFRGEWSSRSEVDLPPTRHLRNSQANQYAVQLCR